MTAMVQHWKTSVAGILSAYIGAVGPLTAYLCTLPNKNAAEIAGAMTCAGLIARVWIGLLQNDAPPNDSVMLNPTAAPKP